MNDSPGVDSCSVGTVGILLSLVQRKERIAISSNNTLRSQAQLRESISNTNPVDTYEEADQVIEATGADIRYGGNNAFFSPSGDFIQVPLREQFSAGEWYETIFHELCHWTRPA